MTETQQTAAAKFFGEAENVIVNLFCRWQDEKAYENIQDYAAALLPIAERCGVAVQAMTQRPFGCTFAADGKRYKLSVNSRTYSYKRIA